MSDDELDRLLAEIAACRDADSFTGSNPPTARDRLRLVIDEAVRAERIRIVEALRVIQRDYATNRPQEWSAINCAIAAIRSNT